MWLFPRLAEAPLHPYRVREYLDQMWEWAFGAAVHRAIITHFAPGRPHEVATSAAIEQVRKAVGSTLAGMDVAQIAALMDQQVDVFGPSDSTHFAAWQWGRSAEFVIGNAMGENAWANSTSDMVRYRSFDDMNLLDKSEIQARIADRWQFYAQAPADIAAVWRGLPTQAQQQALDTRRARNEAIKSGAKSVIRGVGERQDRKAKRRAANAAAQSEAALTELRRARSAQLRRGRWF